MNKQELALNVLSILLGDESKKDSRLNEEESTNNIDDCVLGKKVIIRTYSAGVFFGELFKKSGNEVILKNARRLYSWKAAESITLQAVALHGINENGSRIVEAVPYQWMEAIEIIPCSKKSIDSLEGAKNAKAG